MKKEDKMDKLFREKLEHYQATPPDDAWVNIQQIIKKSNRRNKMILWRVAAILVVAFIVGWQIWKSGKDQLKSENTLSDYKSTEQTIKESETSTVKLEEPIETKEKESLPTYTSPKSNVVITQPEKKQIVTTIQADEKIKVKESLNSLKLIDPFVSSNRTGILYSQNIKLPATSENELTTSDQEIIRRNESLFISEKQSNQRNWLVGAQVSPTLSLSESSHTLLYASNMTNQGDNDQISVAGGLSVEYQSGKRWSIQSGVYYSSMGQNSYNTYTRVSSTPVYEGAIGSTDGETFVNISTNSFVLNSIAGKINVEKIPDGIQLSSEFESWSPTQNSLASEVEFIQNFEYIEIPLYIRYLVFDSKLDVQLLGGFSTNLLVGNDAYLVDNNQKDRIGKTDDMESMSLSGTLGIGFRYGLSKKVYLNLEPRVKYFLNSLNANPDVDYKAYTIGVFTGLSYRF